MVVITAQSGETATYIKSLQADTEQDLLNYDKTSVVPGSDCFVLETGNVYILNSNKEWVLI